MQTLKYVIKDDIGIHARPAGQLVNLAKSYQSDMKITKDDKSVNLKSVLKVLGLAVKKDNEVIIEIEGEDELLAIAEITEFFKNNL